MVKTVKSKKKLKKKEKKKASALYDQQHEDELANISTTFVFRYGGSSTSKKKQATINLRDDFRSVFSPYTAKNLQEKESNSMKDFIGIGTGMGIDFFHVFSGSDFSLLWRMMKIPQGPTVTLKIKEYSLMKEVQSLLGQYNGKFTNAPLVVINGFPKDSNEYKLLSTAILSTFPPISSETFNPDKCKRCVLFSYDKNEDVIYFRHYMINQKKLGVDKTTRRIERLSKKTVNLRKVDDISDYLLREIDSESETEETSQTKLPQNQNQKIAIKLKEIGPRMTLDLIKIEDGLYTEKCKTLFNKFVSLSEDEKKKLLKKQDEEMLKKKERREQQERNVEKKKKKKEEEKQKNKKNIKNEEENLENEENEENEEENEDLEWYKKEVGRMPDPEEMGSFKKTKIERKNNKKNKENNAEEKKNSKNHEKRKQNDKKPAVKKFKKSNF